MSESIKSVAQLTEYTFYVPAYQRGYRWTALEVRDLLQDIYDFSLSSSSSTTWYCLQPLVVRKRALSNGRPSFELVDGQQRVTSILLVGRYINEMWPEREKDPELQMEYESRANTQEFLKTLTDADAVIVNDTNIDFYHISKAYSEISKWVKSQPDFKRDAFIAAFLRSVKVIWYEVESESIEIFTRLNMGKIPLTNAELIKALFLRNSNFCDQMGLGSAIEKLRLQQMEISSEWDRMEASLQNPEFWYFLTSEQDKIETRIDLIFSLMTGKALSGRDTYEIFRVFQENWKATSVQERWLEVKRCFQTLEEWYHDRERYHHIGYLICSGVSLLEIFRLSQGKKKSELGRELRERIFKNIPRDLESITYKGESVRRVLLLHNILSLLESRDSLARFPFDRYKLEQWDVEHIHSVQELPPGTERHQREWLEEAASHCPDALKKRVQAQLQQPQWLETLVSQLMQDVLNAFSEANQDQEDINDLSNLVLLDRCTNRGYGNAVFPVKRQKIIVREKKGVFIPLCTKNVFMKFYSEKIENFTFWGEHDREAYFNDIMRVLKS